MGTAVTAGTTTGEVGVGFGVAAIVGGTLLVTALLLAARAVRSPRTPLVAAGSLLGAAGVLAQLSLTAGDPASRVGYLLGLLGAMGWYSTAVRLLSERVTGVGRQWLAVGSLLWVGGTVTVTTTAAPADWPLVWSLFAGVGVVGLALAAWLTDAADRGPPWDRWLAVLGGVLLAPAVLGLLAGEEILFVAYLLAAATSVVCWSLVRLAL
jgi:drug/metabolite transporter (DMT)-like permease